MRDPNADDEEDLGAVSMDSRIFGPSPVTEPTPDTPSVREGFFARRMNGEYEGFPFEQPHGPLNPQQQAEVQGIIKALGNFFYNSQITAALPAHNVPTNWSDPIDRSGVLTIPAAVDVNWSTLSEYTVPPGRWARINGYGINVRETTYTYDGSLVWRILVNGNPVPTLNEFAEQRGTLVNPREVFFLARQDHKVALQVRRKVAGTNPNTVEGALVGYTWRLRNDFEGTRASVSAY